MVIILVICDSVIWEYDVIMICYEGDDTGFILYSDYDVKYIVISLW